MISKKINSSTLENVTESIHYFEKWHVRVKELSIFPNQTVTNGKKKKLLKTVSVYRSIPTNNEEMIQYHHFATLMN